MIEPGDSAPDFEATLHDGSIVSLTELVAEGPVVLSLLRSFS